MVHGGSSLVEYVLRTEDGTHCPNCRNKQIYLLSTKDIIGFTLPAFYICFNCHMIGQIAVGEVPYESKFDIEEEDVSDG